MKAPADKKSDRTLKFILIGSVALLVVALVALVLIEAIAVRPGLVSRAGVFIVPLAIVLVVAFGLLTFGPQIRKVTVQAGDLISFVVKKKDRDEVRRRRTEELDEGKPKPPIHPTSDDEGNSSTT